jgi:TolA-binding protein
MVAPGQEEERLRLVLRDMESRIAELEEQLVSSANEN